MDVNLRLLESLLAVAEEGSISRASVRLHLTQQAVSGHIGRLEKALGHSLFKRTPQGTSLTPTGEAAVRHALQILSAVDSMVAEIGCHAPSTLRMVFNVHCTARFLPKVTAHLRQCVPGIRIQAIPTLSRTEAVQLLIEDRADAALLWLPVGDDRLAVSPILSEPRVVAVPPDHRLAERSQVALADITDEPIIGPHSLIPAEVRREWFIEPRPNSHPVQYGPEGRTPEECLQFVADHYGIWIAPEAMSKHFTHPVLSWPSLTDVAPIRVGLAWIHRRTSPFMMNLLNTNKPPSRLSCDPLGDPQPRLACLAVCLLPRRSRCGVPARGVGHPANRSRRERPGAQPRLRPRQGHRRPWPGLWGGPAVRRGRGGRR
ncbi:LysR family transcriptional regulator [Kitasatospora sp. NPDC059827]|uniref:LysR family transcriptional regulator n=1 Tax=Kitasatospora sp. NPDC059827 TaxID=3346964 RepID=UPI003669F98D